ncbi:MAG TPA: PIN domain-containing protein [Anaerolineae bacterium]|nr:PIN domain-containing protein [Anaerolineae bacterium]
MDEVFVDTAGWAVLFISTEPQHAQASELFRRWKRQRRRLVTTNYVLAELVSLFISPLRVPRPAQFRYVDAIKTAPYVEIVHVDPSLDAAAWALLKSRPDRDWSLVDATSFIVMQKRGIIEALTTDHHFEQAGFMRLLKP